MFLRESLNALRWNFQHLWLEYGASLHSADLLTIDSPKLPILLVPGIYASARSFLPLKKFLETCGYSVYCASTKRNTRPVPELARELALFAHELALPKFQIIAHSLGGLTTLAMLHEHPTLDARVEKVIALGVPFGGCQLGTLAFWEFGRNREFVKQHSLTTRRYTSDARRNQKVHALFARRDRIVSPQHCSVLAGAVENTELPLVGHTSLILDPRSFEAIRTRLL